jgi:hypothetical protein
VDAASRAEVKKIATRALWRQADVNNKLASLPEELASSLFEALNPLLLCYKSPAVDREASKARREKLQELHGKRLIEIYSRAINLRKDLSRKGFSYSFYWIQAGEAFNNTIMDAEIHSRRIEFYETVNRELKVVVTVLPGICRNDDGTERPMLSTEPSQEKNIVVRALVYLGAEERQ